MPQLAPSTSTRLWQLIALKLLLDVLILTAIIAFDSYANLGPPYRGWFDGIANGRATGWVVDGDNQERAVEIQVFVDGNYAGHAKADNQRPDVVAAGKSVTSACGYEIDLPYLAPGRHEGRAYAVNASGATIHLRQIGPAVQFDIEEQR